MVELFSIGFLSVTLVDIFDILIVSALFFWIYKNLKDTIAIQILFGLVVLIGLSFISEAINLKSINWILKTLSDIWLIAFIIIFREEIRRLLLIITRSSIFQMFIKTSNSETFNILSEAVKELADKHIGALIILTRSQNIEMTVEKGFEVGAMVTKEIILSIFNPKSPLHDGAIIIENKTIVSAKNTLPLSKKIKSTKKNLGTRHKAALGLAEMTDALVIVVSEETGAISLANEGILYYNIHKEIFTEVLNASYNNESIEDYVVENNIQKI